MNSKGYKWCVVPQCDNNSKNCPKKLFIYVPHNKTIRKKWFTAAGRDPAYFSLNSTIYFCEDHFDLPNDMANFMKYHVMGSVSQVLMKPNCIPSKFECQSEKRKQTTMTEQPIHKKQRKQIIRECYKDTIKSNTPLESTPSENSVFRDNFDTQEEAHKTLNTATEVYKTPKFRRKAPKTKIKLVNQQTSLKKYAKLFAVENHSNNEEFSQIDCSTIDCSGTKDVQDDKKKMASKLLECTLYKIINNPLTYIGVHKSCYHLVNLIEKETNIPTNHILLCLKKIKTNSSYVELADDFSMTPSCASKTFLKNIPKIASVLRPFITILEKQSIENNLPRNFCYKYHDVCIIDCLEINIQEPSKPLYQSLSWSEYKKFTIKYLLSCTPNGLVNYISPGFGGRITNTGLVKSCDFIKSLKPSMCVIADRNFGDVQKYLWGQGVQFIQTPSLTIGAKFSRETNQIASLRFHCKRVISRLREFDMLKPCAMLNLNLVKVLDDVIAIACSLINLRNSVIIQ